MFWNSVTFEVTQTRRKYIRAVYNIPNLLRDIGGLLSALIIISKGIVYTSQYSGSYIFLARHLRKSLRRKNTRKASD